MDFELPADLYDLQDEARRLGAKWASSPPFPDDSWIVGFSRELAAELGRRGWIGMTWPRGEGGHGRSPLERFVVFEALISEGAPIAAMWIADRQIGPTLLQFGTATSSASDSSGSRGEVRQLIPSAVTGIQRPEGCAPLGSYPWGGITTCRRSLRRLR